METWSLEKPFTEGNKGNEVEEAGQASIVVTGSAFPSLSSVFITSVECLCDFAPTELILIKRSGFLQVLHAYGAHGGIWHVSEDECFMLSLRAILLTGRRKSSVPTGRRNSFGARPATSHFVAG
jgi:hypothetical protein